MTNAFNALTAIPGTRGLVKDVAFENGYDDPAHFVRVFRRQFGVTPGDVIGLGVPTVVAAENPGGARQTRAVGGRNPNIGVSSVYQI